MCCLGHAQELWLTVCAHREPDADFEQVDVVVWDSGKSYANDRPLGKVTLSAERLTALGSSDQQEQWLPLQSAAKEETVRGDLIVDVTIAPPANNRAALTVLGQSWRSLCDAHAVHTAHAGEPVQWRVRATSPPPT
jgi:hypothetical protein